MLTAQDIARECCIPLRTAQRYLARWYARGLAVRLTSRGGRPPLAISAEALAGLSGTAAYEDA